MVTNIKYLVLLFAILITSNSSADELSDAYDAYKISDYTTAFELFKKLAEQGDEEGQYSLGVMHSNGEGVPQDYKQAVHWYTKAAEQGQSEAQYGLAIMYISGNGIKQDNEQAVHWYTKSAEQGYADAQMMLGILYSQGKGVLKDYAKSHMYLNIAAVNGNQDAKHFRDKIVRMMSPEQISEAQRLVNVWMEKHPS